MNGSSISMRIFKHSIKEFIHLWISHISWKLRYIINKFRRFYIFNYLSLCQYFNILSFNDFEDLLIITTLSTLSCDLWFFLSLLPKSLLFNNIILLLYNRYLLIILLLNLQKALSFNVASPLPSSYRLLSLFFLHFPLNLVDLLNELPLYFITYLSNISYHSHCIFSFSHFAVIPYVPRIRHVQKKLGPNSLYDFLHYL